MPIPKPVSGESEKDFLSRCMSDSTMRSEYSNQDQRVAVCLNSFQNPKEDIKEMSDMDTLDQQEEDFMKGTLHVAAEIKALDDEQGEASKGEFSGYGSIFGNKDLGNDTVVKGAFAKSIARKGPKGVKLLYQHRSDEPIGVFDEILEDNKGLKVKGRLAMGTQKGREVYELMKMGALDGLSIGFRVDQKGYDYDERGKRRMLKEVDLMEISAVTFPMNPRARINQVKGADRTIREWEDELRDAFDLSRKEAKVAASAVCKALAPLREADRADEPEELVSSLNSLLNVIQGDRNV